MIANNLVLERPLAWFDLETTGISTVTDRIIEIHINRQNVDGSVTEYYTLVNPEVSIDPGATKIHGHTDESLKDAPKFADVADDIMSFIEGCDFGGYNIKRFDIPLLNEELLRAGKSYDFRKCRILDPYLILSKIESRKLAGFYKRFTGKELKNAHQANADNIATIEGFDGMYKEFDLPTNVDELHAIAIEDDQLVDYASKFVKKEFRGANHIMFNFGKYKGEPVKHIFEGTDKHTADPNYLDWIISKDFSLDTKRCAKIIKKALIDGRL